MKQLERLQMSAVPALQALNHHGWVLRFANGLGNQANSVFAFEHHSDNIMQKIDFCEAAYQAKAMRPAFRICPVSEPASLDELLATRGYLKIHRTSIMTLPISPAESVFAGNLSLTDHPAQAWFRHFARLSTMSRNHQLTFSRMLNRIVPPTVYATLADRDEIIACCMAVIDNRHAGLFDLIVDERHRRLGWGCNLLTGLMEACRLRGASTAYLQVAVENDPACCLYDKLGFVKAYEYHYRVLPS